MTIVYNPLGTKVEGDYKNTPYPNLSGTITIQGVIVEDRKPTVVNTGDAPVSGGPSNVPQIATGDIRNTSVYVSNQRREHRCDFILELRKNDKLKKFLRAVASKIRDAIRWVLKKLGLTDVSGNFTETINTLKAWARELRRIQKEIIQPIIDFEKYVLAYITKIRALVQWILSLPAKLLALLAQCLQRLLKLIGSIFTDLMSEIAQDSVTGEKLIDNFDSQGFKDLIAASKDLVSAAGETISSAAEAVKLGLTIPLAATAGLLVPVSDSELEAANSYIDTYESENPNIASFAQNSKSLSYLRDYGFPPADTINTTVSENRPATP